MVLGAAEEVLGASRCRPRRDAHRPQARHRSSYGAQLPGRRLRARRSEAAEREPRAGRRPRRSPCSLSRSPTWRLGTSRRSGLWLPRPVASEAGYWTWRPRSARNSSASSSAWLSPAFPHPHPATYRLPDFLPDLRPERVGKPSVVLSLRDDRRWGRTGRSQRQNVHDLCSHLRRRFPEAAFTAIGIGGEAPLPDEVRDQRSRAPTGHDEKTWLSLAAGADLAVGVHGSNLLLPSGLASSCVELVPRGRYGNVLQATLLDDDDPLETLWRHRFVYGNGSLSDVAGKRVGAIAAELLAGDDRFHDVMLGPLAGRGGNLPGPVGAGSAPVPASLQLRLHHAARGARRATGAAATILRSRAT